MNEIKQSIKKKRILKYFGIFVVCLLIATFFSKSIHNVTLPKVTYQKPDAGYIYHEVSFSNTATTELTTSRYAGFITKVTSVLFKEGDQVSSGDIVLILDDSEFQKEKDNLEYRIESCLKKLSITSNNLNALIKRTCLVYEETVAQSEKKYEIDKRLFENGIISESEFKSSELNLKKAEASYEDVILMEKDKVSDLEFELNDLNHQLEGCLKQIDDCIVTAQNDGILGAFTYRKGMTTNPNSLLFENYQTGNGLNIKHQLDPDQSRYLSVGDEVNLSVLVNNYLSSGVITSIDSDATASKADITIAINKSDNIKYGDAVKVSIKKTIATYDCVLPIEAVHSDNGKDYVYVIKEEDGPLGKEYYCIKQAVTVGEKNSRMVGITTPIDRRSKIIVRSSKPLFGDKMEVFIER